MSQLQILLPRTHTNTGHARFPYLEMCVRERERTRARTRMRAWQRRGAKGLLNAATGARQVCIQKQPL